MTEPYTADYVWMDGGLVPWDQALVHVNLLGHATVSSVYEGIKAYWNVNAKQLFLFRLDDHLRRFMESVKMARLNCRYSLDDLRKATLTLVLANEAREDFYVTLLIYKTGVLRWYSFPDLDHTTDVVIDMWPFTSHMTTERSVNTGVSSWTRLSDNSSPNRIKCVSNYHNGRMASIEAALNGYDAAIMLNDRGKVSEEPGACLFLVRKGKVVTPSITSDILESITRDTILRICTEVLQIPTEERDVDRTELYIADEVFFCGTGREVLPVASVDRLPVGNGQMGPVTKAIDQAYHDIVRGIDARYDEWCTPVW
jgi:branched-chain amino acid aminotransferase